MKSEFKDCYKGLDGQYDFHKKFSHMDPNNKDKNWLYEQKESFVNSEAMLQKYFHTKPNSADILSLDDVTNNPEQENVALAIIEKLKEWIDFPQQHEENPSLKLFQPLLLTVQREGGTGKSHVIKVVTNAVEKVFDVKVSITCAPTGNAAYNVKGKTCHSFFSIDIDSGTVGTLSHSRQSKLKETLQRLLMIIIDERSFLSCEDLAKVHSNCVNFAHRSRGIPIVVLLGDDKQIPVVN